MLHSGSRYKRYAGVALAVLLALGAVQVGTAQAASGAAVMSPVVSIVKKTSPAVVNIDVETKAFPFGDNIERAYESGVRYIV